MKWLIKTLGRIVGLHFAPDNHLTPVLRLGRYRRVAGPGFFWINPLLSSTLPPVSTGVRVTKLLFTEVLSQDNIPFTVELTVLYTFDPAASLPNVAAQLVRAPTTVLDDIVKDYASQGLRRLASRYKAETLSSEDASGSIETNLTNFLRAEMTVLGLAPLRKGGVLLKEIIAPEKFQRAMLVVRRLEAILAVLARHPADSLIQQMLQTEFVTGLSEIEGDLTLLSTLAPLESLPLDTLLDMQKVSIPSGQNGHSKS